MITSPIGAILSENLKSVIGWYGMYFMCAGFSLISKFVLRAYKEFEDTKGGRQKSLSWKTDKTMANKMKRKTNIEYRTLH